MPSFPVVCGRTVFDALDEDAGLLVAVVALDGGLAVDQAVVVVDFDAVTVGGKNDCLTLQFVALRKSDFGISFYNRHFILILSLQDRVSTLMDLYPSVCQQLDLLGFLKSNLQSGVNYINYC